MPVFEPIVGRYFTMSVNGQPCRIYVEEAGKGIPLICLHTAGSDSANTAIYYVMKPSPRTSE